MSGRRLSSNDVSVVIALAIVVLVLLLIYVAAREARADRLAQAVAGVARTGAGITPPQPFPEPPSGEASNVGAVDACGGGTPKDEEVASVGRELLERQRHEALQTILSALDARPEPRARAAGLYFRAARDRVDTRAADKCKASPDTCSSTDTQYPDDRDSAEALARLAVSSSDPQVYAWAYRSCAAVPRERAGSCQLISALQWARLDPGNAEPWLSVAREAKRRNDAAGLDDAMFQVASAAVHDPGWGRASAQMAQAVPRSDATAVGTWLVSLDAIGYETLDLAIPETSRYCDARSVADANRRDTCEKIAALLVDRSTTLLGRAIGIALGRRLDWPPARLASVELERDAASAVERRDALPPSEPLSCSIVRRDLSHLVAAAQIGEVEALRRRIAATGESIESLAAESRRTARLDDEAEAAGATGSALTVGAVR